MTNGNRKFTGNPIDLTWQPGPWARNDSGDDDEGDEPCGSNAKSATDAMVGTLDAARERLENTGELNGETVGGTSSDDFHDTETEFLPSDVDPDVLSQRSKQIIEAAVVNPGIDIEMIAKIADTTAFRVQDTLETYYPNGLPDRDTDESDQSEQPMSTETTADDSTDEEPKTTTFEYDGETRETECTTYPHQDPDILRWLHHDHQLRPEKIAEIIGSSPTSVHRWLGEHGIVNVRWKQGETIETARRREQRESEPEETAADTDAETADTTDTTGTDAETTGGQDTTISPSIATDDEQSDPHAEKRAEIEAAMQEELDEMNAAEDEAREEMDAELDAIIDDHNESATPAESVRLDVSVPGHDEGADALADVEQFVEDMAAMAENELSMASAAMVEQHATSKLTAFRTVLDYIQRVQERETE